MFKKQIDWRKVCGKLLDEANRSQDLAELNREFPPIWSANHTTAIVLASIASAINEGLK